jgi:glucoamylase
LHWGVAWARAAVGLVAVFAVAAVLVSGGSSSDPRTPAGLAGMPPPFLGTAVVGAGEMTAAIDSYGAVVDLRPAPAGPALIDNPVERQTAETVAPETGIVPRLRLGDGRALPFWRADAVSQRYLPGTNALVTTARFGEMQARVTYAAGDGLLACATETSAPSARVELGAENTALRARLRCDDELARAAIEAATRADRRWLTASAGLGEAAPGWAEAMYRRSLLVLRAFTDRRSGAVAAGARDGWAYVWPRDAAAVALALGAAGHRGEARRVAGFLRKLPLRAAARFHGDGSPVPGRDAQGDAAGWVAVAARAANLDSATATLGPSWLNRADYQEKAPGEYLGNALAASETGDPSRPSAAAIAARFGKRGALARSAGDPADLDSAAAWAVRPFPQPRLFPSARHSLRGLLAAGGRFGIVPSSDWPEPDPWTAPTAWSAWAFAALPHASDRRAALALLAGLRRAATPAGDLPERVDVHTGVPRSTTPLAWSHAFAILALRELWPEQK